MRNSFHANCSTCRQDFEPGSGEITPPAVEGQTWDFVCDGCRSRVDHLAANLFSDMVQRAVSEGAQGIIPRSRLRQDAMSEARRRVEEQRVAERRAQNENLRLNRAERPFDRPQTVPAGEGPWGEINFADLFRRSRSDPTALMSEAQIMEATALRDLGYRIVSNNARVIARIDRSNWVDHMIARMGPVRDNSLSDEDLYRRRWSADRKTMNGEKWKGYARIIGNSTIPNGQDEPGYIPKSTDTTNDLPARGGPRKRGLIL